MEKTFADKKMYSPILREKVFSEQIKILHHNLLASIPGNFVCALIVSICLYQRGNTTIALVWLSATVVVSCIRLAGFYFYHRHAENNELHLMIFIGGLTLSAILWALINSIFMPANDLMSQMIIMVIVAGVTAGGVQTLNANLLSCMIYLCTILVPLCIWLFMQNTFTYLLLDFAITTYFAFMLVTSIRVNRLLTSALLLKHENQMLVDKLSDSNTKLLKAYQVMEKHEHKIVLLNKMNDMLQACSTSNEAYTIIQFIGKDLLENINGAFFMLNSTNEQFELVTNWGNAESLNTYISKNDCWALRKGHEYQLTHPQANMTCKHFTRSQQGSLCLPINIQPQNMGLFILYTDVPGALTREVSQLAHAFIEGIQLSLTNIKLRERLYQQSIHDPLTGLFNRRYLDETLARELLRINREQKSLCVAMIDIDHFKSFNDTYGHEAGDQALKLVGKLLQENFRGSDISSRFGGEEFVVVLVHSNIDASLNHLERFSEQIRNAKLHFKGRLLPSITLSIGLAEAPSQGRTVNDIIHSADTALYTAKKLGRNRIIRSTTEMAEC